MEVWASLEFKMHQDQHPSLFYTMVHDAWILRGRTKRENDRKQAMKWPMNNSDSNQRHTHHCSLGPRKSPAVLWSKPFNYPVPGTQDSLQQSYESPINISIILSQGHSSKSCRHLSKITQWENNMTESESRLGWPPILYFLYGQLIQLSLGSIWASSIHSS